jgi:sorting nexin-29
MGGRYYLPYTQEGGQLECGNYRGITLLNTAYKIFSNILFERLEPYVNTILGNYQCGFRKGKSTVHQIFSLRQILEKQGRIILV